MIIAEMRSGLGNQLFQYAFGLSLATRNETVLKLDLDFYHHYQLRRFELGNLAISARKKDKLSRLALRLSRAPLPDHLAILEKGLRGAVLFATLVDRQGGFDAEAYARRGNLYLRGYWQSWKYFDDIRPILLKELSVPSAPNAANAAILRHIAHASSVCIHVRRGDFVDNKELQHIFGACRPDYYEAAIELVRARVSNPTFFVFSDDLQWVRRNLDVGESAVFVDCNKDASPVHDMRLMATCNHFIISNSTFGWWGAWLSTSPDKIVVAPETWYKSTWTARDLVPPGWITLPNGLC